ncbi:Gypsy retrotransposon integrase-like protein 1 [Smittium culicis]|uniref:Gypsy retrotransposon integrase-like protein 1 n=1 Tax=Smittium culicis TaxID=133412 RepID=A0A1R1XB04_9FUNG|nr:Gypsy retrotransposon integrase-like protein 1 [Smittium culicis]
MMGLNDDFESTKNFEDQNKASKRFYEPKAFNGSSDSDPEVWIKRYELYSRKLKWDESDKMDLLELYLSNKALTWFERTRDTVKTWSNLKKKFLDKFEGQESEIRVWKQLQGIKQDTNEEVDEFAARLSKLLSKAKITDEESKRKYLISALLPKYQRSVLKSDSKTFEESIAIAAKEEELDRLIGTGSEAQIKSNALATDRIKVTKLENPEAENSSEKDQMYEAMVKKFEELSVNLITTIENKAKLLDRQPYNREKQELYEKGACFYCKEVGHKSSFCAKAPWNNNSSSGKIRSSYTPLRKDVDCIEIGNMEEFHTKQENLIDGCEEVFATEKRRIQLKPPQLNKKVILSSEKDSENITAAIKVKQLSSIRKKGEIGLVGGITAYSIKENLASSDANISIAQLLQVSPEIRQELGKLCKKTEIPSHINYVEKEKENEITNCKALVKIFGERYWAVVDTGAACSVVTKPLLDKLGIAADHKSSQVIITADGNRHDTYGHVLDVPIEISNYSFNVDFLVMNQNKEVLILGVDWLKKHQGIIDMKNNELIFPKDEYEIILSLSTNRIEESGHNEIFGIGKEVYSTEFEKGNMKDPRIEKFLADNSEVLASDISELTQTTAITHKIDTGLEPPIKMKPYRIPKSMKEEARNEIEKTSGRLARWSMLLKEYDYDITHRKGSKNPSDYLSRAPRNSKAQNDLIDEEDVDIFAYDFAAYLAIKNYLSKNEYPLDANNTFKGNFRKKAKKFLLKDDKLYQKTKKLGLRELLHERNAKELIHEIHNADHSGIVNTWEKVKLDYYGTELYDIVTEVVNSCEICQRFTGKPKRNNKMNPISATLPFQIVGIDAIGPINPISEDGNRYMLTAIDYLTKWPIIKAVPDIKTTTVINFLVHDVVQNYGVPSKLITDRGANFVSDLAEQFYEFIGINHAPTTAYRPQSNGQAIEERVKFMTEKIELLRNIAADKIVVNKKYEKKRYDEKVKEYKFKEGDKVLRAMEQANSKFDPVWEGPFKVTKAYGKGSYRISDSFGTEDLVNGDRLKTYKESGKMIPEVRPAALRPTIKRFRETIRFGRDSRI